MTSSRASSREGKLREALARYMKPHVLVVDEVGYLAYGDDAANVLYHVVNDRHIRGRSMIFTTNKHPKRWGDVLHDDDLADAIVDRILQRGRLLRLDGPSVRTKHLPDDELRIDVQDNVGGGRVSGIEAAEFPERTPVRPRSRPRLGEPQDYLERFEPISAALDQASLNLLSLSERSFSYSAFAAPAGTPAMTQLPSRNIAHFRRPTPRPGQSRRPPSCRYVLMQLVEWRRARVNELAGLAPRKRGPADVFGGGRCGPGSGSEHWARRVVTAQDEKHVRKARLARSVDDRTLGPHGASGLLDGRARCGAPSRHSASLGQ